MDANINNEENYHQQAADGRRRIARRRARRLELITVLQQTEEFPSRSENKTDELVETFLETLKDDIHDMICESDYDDGNYQGLDSDRDTEAEVETVLRLFPGVMTRRKEIVYYEDDDDEEEEMVHYPIQLLAVTFHADSVWCNVKSVSFIPLVAKLAIELDLFDEQQRGGLLIEGEGQHEGQHVLHSLMCTDSVKRRSQERYEYIDDKYLRVLIQLRKLGLLKKEDIRRYCLLYNLCGEEDYFAEKRFRFLVEWDPSALIQTTGYGYVPLNLTVATSKSSIRGFQSVFEYGIHYFPNKKGINLLFRKTHYGGTPFKFACDNYGHEHVTEVVEDTLIRYSTSLDNHAPPFNIVEALMMAATDENVHLDCVYFLIRREPDILQKLLSSLTSSSSSIESATHINHNKRKRNDKKKDDDDDGN
ncbi:hypothetical protein FRACYDRAFT_233381 [Fragilariopsis cylindrus CCMP1102]|uniref:Uncharacterized protein n=1 Tax=Fragilariopsis cylindrus CCMP1102 TaxID=635003 RepID=A0A1E7FYI0_9STRA|nr:hypothetical protein FRACYDRAFT_233381 [Fragilariopsis cylindrus CCMP1102]|eukprot:OEU23212.1 hypothetical protein FRACYDRAFT_233381 [Fragilariopsis cylindrus CCMP1102]